MLSSLLVALGGALGSLARYWISQYMVLRHGTPPTWAILAVNASGSLLIGAIAALTGPDGRWTAPPGFRLFLMVGICGGYTTFSSFSLQTFELARAGEFLLAGLNILASVACCLAAVWLGYSAALFLGRR